MKKNTSTIKEPSPVYHVEHQNDVPMFNGEANVSDIRETNRMKKLRDFVYSHLPLDLAQQLEAEDFLKGRPMPNQVEPGELKAQLLEADASGYLTEEETEKLFEDC